MNKLFKINENCFVYDSKRQSVYEGTIQGKIYGTGGKIIYLITPVNKYLPPMVKIPFNNVYKTFKQAFTKAMEVD